MKFRIYKGNHLWWLSGRREGYIKPGIVKSFDGFATFDEAVQALNSIIKEYARSFA